MKKIVIVANFCRGLDGTNHSRFVYLAEMLTATGRYKVELVTSDFHHLSKTHIDESNAGRYNFDIKLCHEPGYVSHKGLKRLMSHYRWGKSVLRYLKSQPSPDVVYCAIPSLTAAHGLAKYCKSRGVKFVIDVQDLWPEAIFMLADNGFIKTATWPMKKYVETAYRNADAIVAVSRTYAARAAAVNEKGAEALSVFLGSDGARFEAARTVRASQEMPFTIGYIGTISYSYDIGCVIDTIKLLDESGEYPPIKFLVMGDGPLLSQFRERAEEGNVDCEFTGMLAYEEMVASMCGCDILVNPIVQGAAQSITNKVGDYALSGLPVVNTQECAEYRDLLARYDCGINCTPGDVAELARAIAWLIRNPERRYEMGRNAARLGHDKFDRRTAYGQIVEMLDRLTYSKC